MKVIECPHEHDVVAAVTNGRWGDPSFRELREHVRGCAICSEVADVAEALSADRVTASAPVPSAAHVWWRAQMRARQEAARTVSAPLNVVQAFAAAAAIGLVAAVIMTAVMMTAWSEQAWTPSAVEKLVSGWASGAVGAVRAIAFASPRATVVFATVVACLVLMPIGMYFALSENESDASSPKP